LFSPGIGNKPDGVAAFAVGKSTEKAKIMRNDELLIDDGRSLRFLFFIKKIS